MSRRRCSEPSNSFGWRKRDLPRATELPVPHVSKLAVRSAGRSGISLLECTVALVILSISLLGLTRLIVDNERMLSQIESWCASEPTYYVVRPEDDLDRTLGSPARLSTTPGGGIAEAPPNTPYEIVVLSRSRNLNPESATAVVQVVSP
jgi:hypothetical protein